MSLTASEGGGRTALDAESGTCASLAFSGPLEVEKITGSSYLKWPSAERAASGLCQAPRAFSAASVSLNQPQLPCLLIQLCPSAPSLLPPSLSAERDTWGVHLVAASPPGSPRGSCSGQQLHLLPLCPGRHGQIPLSEGEKRWGPVSLHSQPQ